MQQIQQPVPVNPIKPLNIQQLNSTTHTVQQIHFLQQQQQLFLLNQHNQQTLLAQQLPTFMGTAPLAHSVPVPKQSRYGLRSSAINTLFGSEKRPNPNSEKNNNQPNKLQKRN